MPPMPPGGIAGVFSFSGISVTSASVVSNRPAIEAAFCNALRVTLVGSTMPAFTRSTYSPLATSYPSLPLRFFTSSTMRAPSAPALLASCRIGSSIARRTIWTPTFSSASRPRMFSSDFWARINATPPPATMPSSTAARVFRQSLLEFLAIVIAGRLFNLTTDLSDAALDVGVLAGTFDDGRVFLVDGHALGLAQVFELNVLELDPEVFADHFAAGQHRDVFQHRLATIAEARGFDRADLQCAAQFVHDQSRERFAFHVFRDNEQRTSGFCDFLEQRSE